MTRPPDDHTLNACLARVVGLRWGYAPDLNEHGYFDRDGHLRYTAHNWEPVTDPVQMEEVEAWLVENGYEFGSAWSKSDGYYTAHVLLDPNPSGDPRILYRTAMDPDKKRAFALAAQAMEQSNNNNKED